MLELFNEVYAKLEKQREKAHNVYNEYCGLIPIKAIHIKRKEIGNENYTTFNFNQHTKRNDFNTNNRNIIPRKRDVKRNESYNNNRQSNLFK